MPKRKQDSHYKRPGEAVSAVQGASSMDLGQESSSDHESIDETLAQMKNDVVRTQQRCGDLEDESDYVPSSGSDSSDSSDKVEYEVEIEKENTADGATTRDAVADSTTELNSSKKSRKRMTNPSNWRRNVRKTRRERGLEKAAPIGIQLCKENCKKKCSTKISDEQRQQLFDYFYSLDQQGKDVHLFHCIVAHPPVRKRPGANRHHHMSYLFAVRVGESEPIAVCKEALSTIFRISRKVIDRIKLSIGQPGHSSTVQGKHNNRPNRISAEAVELIKQHISSFPAEVSHYSRHFNPNRMYLTPILSINKMHSLYKEKCKEEKKKFVSLNFYQQIFNTEFNLGFGTPKTDVCAKCDANESSSLTEHKAAAKMASDELSKDRQTARDDSSYMFITFDLQKTLPLPKIPTSIAFYLRQLWFYNCGIHCVTQSGENGFHFNWTENEAGKGCEEICSSLIAFFEETEDFNARHLVAWSDSCAGQNKNFTVLTLWQYLLTMGRFDLIDHKFPEVGHSFKDSDRDFALIEKAVRKHERIYSAEEYRAVIKSCKKDCRFVCKNIADGLLAAKQFGVALHLKKTNKNLQDEKILFREIRWIRMNKFGYFQYKYSFDEAEPFKEVDIRGRRFVDNVKVDLDRLKKVSGRQVDAKKLADIQKQLPFVPRIHKGFYEKLMPGNVSDSEFDDEF